MAFEPVYLHTTYWYVEALYIIEVYRMFYPRDVLTHWTFCYTGFFISPFFMFTRRIFLPTKGYVLAKFCPMGYFVSLDALFSWTFCSPGILSTNGY